MSLAIGDQAPQFTGQVFGSNQQFSLADHQGSIVLLAFSGITWCGPCQFEAPYLQELWEEFGSGPTFPPVKFFLISTKFGEAEPETALQTQIQAYGLTLPVIINPTAYQLYDVSAVPAVYFVDTAGTICGIHGGAGPPAEELKNAIREELHACGATQSPALGEWAAVAQILFGVSGDAGGFVIVGGKLKKIPPWDPLRRLGSSGRDVLRALAAAELASGIEDAHLRDELRSSAIKSMVEAAGKLQGSKRGQVGTHAPHGTPRTLGPSSSAADI